MEGSEKARTLWVDIQDAEGKDGTYMCYTHVVTLRGDSMLSRCPGHHIYRRNLDLLH